MTTTETDRIELHNELTEAIGPVATKLMQHLPPDWTQLATKTDLANLGTELRGEMTAMEGRINDKFGDLTMQMSKDVRTIVFALMAFTATIVGSIVPAILLAPTG